MPNIKETLILIRTYARLIRPYAWMAYGQQTRDLTAIRAGVVAVRDALPKLRRDDEVHGDALELLGSGLVAEFDLTGHRPALEEAIVVYRDALKLRGLRGGREQLAIHLASALQKSYVVGGDDHALNEALSLLRTRPPTPPVQVALGRLLVRRFEQDCDPATLNEAIELLEAAHRSGRAPEVPIVLGVALARRAEFIGARADLQRGIEMLERFIATVPITNLNAVAARGNLGNALLRAYDNIGDPSMLSRAVRLARETADAVPAESWMHRWAQASLAGVLHRAYHATGDRDTLDEAVAAARATLAATPLDHTERPGTLLGLSALLQTRYGAYRAKEDLTEANALVATALSATTQGWFLSADLLERYNQGILQQYDFTGDQEPLLRAVELLEQLLPGAPSYARPHLAVALGATLATLANATESVSLLDRAIAAFETTLGEDPSKALMVPSQLAGLGMARFSRFCHTNDLADLDRAVVDLIRASQALSSADPRRVSACNALGESLRARFDLRHDVSDARQAIEAYRAAGTQATGTAHERATAAWRWGETEAILGSYDAALTGYETAVSLLDLVAWRGLNAEDRERLLIDFGDLARDVAACAVAAGRPDRAVELLEQGRGVLLSQALDARSGYDLLREQVPELADRLALLSDRLDSTANLDGGLDQRMAFAREREALLTQIREQPGHADFLRPPSLADIRPGPQDGPVVIVNVARLRSDALIVTADDLRVVELSGDLVDQVAQQVSTLLAITADFDNHDRKATGDSLTDILAWLFHTIGQPVLAVLPPAEPPRRVWWCPTGQLSLLPLHAAGSPSGSVLDSVISSYTPTLRILKRARQASPPDVNAGLLTVVPDAHPPLPAVRRATRSVNAATDVTELVGSSATVARMETELPKHPWLHFAGHAAQDLDDPASGGLILDDGALTIRAIIARRLSTATLAFLTGCETARGGEILADEAITLITAMQIAGFRHVVGTLWSVRDAVAARLIRTFYAGLSGSPPDVAHAATALHAATIELRERYATDPLSWTVFIHSGP